MYLNAEARAALKADRDRVLAKAEEDRTALNVREKSGAVSLTGIFIGFLPERARAAATAAAGQGGGGGGAAKKDPPKTMKIIMVDVSDLAAVKVDGYNYDIVSPTEIALPAYDGKLIKAAETTLTAARQAISQAKNAGQEVTEEQKETLATAEADYERAKHPATRVHIRQGEQTLVSWFAKGSAAADLKPGCVVKLRGVEGDASYGNTDGKLYLKVKCDTPLPMGIGDSPFVAFGAYMDLFQQPVRQLPPTPLANPKYGETMVLFFCDYVRSAQDAADGRGPVVRRMLANSQNEKDWQWGKDGKDAEEKKLIGVWTMIQQQDASMPGYPANTFTITATIMDGDWTPAGQASKNALRAGLGFVKADTFAKIMAANPIPALITCSVNTEKTMQQRNAGNEHVVAMWGDNPKFMLRQYLLTNCARVSWPYIRKVFQIKPPTLADEAVSLSRDDPQRPCQLNRYNLISKDGRYVFVNDKVVNISLYTGNLWDLAQQGCEWRVMTSSNLDMDQRAFLATLPTDEAEKVLNGSADAQLILPGEGIIKVFYAVMPMSDDEVAKEMAACDSWRTRRAKLAATREAAANMVVIADNDADGGPMGMDMGPDEIKPEAAAAAGVGADATDAFAQTATQHHATAPMDQGIAEEELAAIEAAEAAEAAAAAAAAQKKKRERPAATAAAAASPDEPPAATASAPKKRAVKATSPAPSGGAGDKAVPATPKKAAAASASASGTGTAKRPVQKAQ